ncbi:aminotransferase class III-fold pyridoxal phosphate-dependent enzyme [Nocardioides sp. QY071]|uniref:aspartate aminotransferase family protein n=1 Tax=Nocardioides sp. QY071 TaxID=3044187 RepID=UPI00249BD68E|nr:aminotransferase class III-fold pyridoxal phosphate-dependent enzyme [Nocardioides sp. QY071]WGY02857.1 aminotransferase class III-fold pyridoxal phosphate-dependent enzyme [Nocardioides sp. QY071]
MALESSRLAFERTRRSVGGGVGSGLRASMRPHPLFVREARGAHVWDLDGDRYVDYVMAWGPLVLGHGDPRVVEAVRDVADRMQVVGTGHELEYLAAEAVLDAVPHGERLLWSNTGTEAVQVALRLARAATGRRRVLKFARSYHGWHDSVYAGLDEADSDRPAAVVSKGQSPSALDDLVVARFNDVAMAERILAEAVERDIAAVLVDPILSNGGVEAPGPDFLPTLRTLCDRHGVVLVFDEVIAGFRVARGGSAERFGVTPDLSVFGKAMAGGLTQSAVVGRAGLIDQVTSGVVHAGTFNANPLALAAVEATMRALDEPGLYEALERVAADFEVKVGAVLAAQPGRGSLNRVGSLLQYVPEGGGTGLHGTGGHWDAILDGMLRRGFLFMPSGKVFLSTAHTASDVEATAEALDKVLCEL